MSESSAARHSSQLPPALPSLELTDVKHGGTSPRDAAATSPGRTAGGREVVVGITAPHHRVAGRNLLWVTTPLAALAGGIGLYAWASGADADNHDDPQTDTLHLRNGLIGAAGLLAGALPPLVAWGRHALQRRDEKHHLLQPDHHSARYQLTRLVDHAVEDSPLTMAGLDTCIARVRAMGQAPGNGLAGRDLGLALARLAQAVPLGHEGCLPCGNPPMAQLERLLQALAQLRQSGALSHEDLKRALVGMAHHLPAAGTQAPVLARTLVAAYQASAGGIDTPVARLWDAADFRVALCGTPCFEHHAETVCAVASDRLGSNAATYGKALTLAPQRAVDRKDMPPAASEPPGIEGFKKQFGAQSTPEARAAVLDTMVVALGRHSARALAREDLVELNRFLSFESSHPGLQHARDRAKFLANHWTDDKRAVDAKASSGLHEVNRELAAQKVIDCTVWSDAPCGVLEALSHVAAQSRDNKVLRELAGEATSIRQVAAHIYRAPAARLKEDVAMAIGIAMNRTTNAMAQAHYALEIARTLQRRTDLPAGALLEGVMSPAAVLQLLGRLGDAEVPEGMKAEDKATLAAELPRLCQLQATPDVLEAAVRTLRRLPQHGPRGVDAPTAERRQASLDLAIVAAIAAANERLVRPAAEGDTPPDVSLRQPWLVPALTRSLREGPAAEDEVIEVRDFERPLPKGKA